MATSTNTRDMLTEPTGLPSAWLGRMLRILQELGLLGTGGRGGGRNAIHFGSMELALIMLALAANRLAEVDAVVKLLRDLPFRGQQPSNISWKPYPFLAEELANWIEGAGAAPRLGKNWTDDSLRMLLSWQINVCLETATVHIQADHTAEDTVHTIYSGQSEPKAPGVRRFTVLTGEVLLAFGELWADTQLARERLAVRGSSAKAVLENENADTSPKVPAPATNQSPAKGSSALTSTDTTGGFASGEVSRGGGTGHASADEPDLFDPARSFRCLTMT